MESELLNLQARLYGRWSAANTSPTFPIYHYTTPLGLAGILAERSFWATNIRFLNDPLELEHASSVIEQVIQDMRATSLSPVQASVLDHVAVVQEMYDSFMDVFIVSFCANKDAKTLWATYNRAEGIAIGIDAEEITQRWDAVGGRILFRVLYEPDEQRELIAAVLEDALAFVAEHSVEIESDPVLGVENVASIVRGVLAEVSTCLKHEHFRDEQEWRAIYVSLRYEVSDSPYRPIQPAIQNGVDFNRVKFRTGLGTLVPYVSVDLFPRDGASRRLPITEFVYGWKLEPSLTRRALEVIKMRYGYGQARIARSEVRFR